MARGRSVSAMRSTHTGRSTTTSKRISVPMWSLLTSQVKQPLAQLCGHLVSSDTIICQQVHHEVWRFYQSTIQVHVNVLENLIVRCTAHDSGCWCSRPNSLLQVFPAFC